MLSVGAMGAGSVSYYANLAKEDYYNNEQEPEGVWLGTGAERLGLKGVIKEEELRNVFRGFSPDGERKLVQNAGKMTGEKSRDSGWDLTFSAPKSISLVAAVADEQTRQVIEKAHFAAIRDVMKEVENSTITRKGKGGKIYEKADIVCATFQHSTSRAVNNEFLPDMQLHTHVLVLNIGVSISDGKTRTIRSENFFNNQQLWGRAYRANLARNMTALNFECERVGDSFELKGVPKELIAEFSKRTEQVKSQTAGITDKAEKERVKLRGRTVKNSFNREELFKFWKEECAKQGFTAQTVLKLTDRESQTEKSIEIETQKCVEVAVSKLQAKQTLFTEKDLKFAVLEEATTHGIGSKNAEKGAAQFLKNRAIFAGERNGEKIYTTDQQAAAETKKFFAEKEAVEKAQFQSLSNFRKNLETDGYKVIGATFTNAKARDFQSKTGIKTATIRKTNAEIKKGFKHKTNAKRKILAEFKYATHQISKETRDKMLGQYHKPETKAINEFKYATWQISKNQRDFLNYQVEREQFKIDEKTVLILDAKISERNREIKTIISEIKNRGGKVITVSEILQANRQEQQTREAQANELSNAQEQTYTLNQQR